MIIDVNQRRKLAQLLLDAFDMDLHVYSVKVIQSLRQTDFGEDLSLWADENPVLFRNALRGVSLIVQRSEAKSPVIETVMDQLERWPAEIFLSFEGAPSMSTAESEYFAQRYREAIKDLAEEDLCKVGDLSQRRLKEWVNAPERMRPILLEKWSNEGSLFHRVDKKFEEWGDSLHNLANKIEENTPGRGSIVVSEAAIIDGPGLKGIRCRVVDEVITLESGISIPTEQITVIRVKRGILRRTGENIHVDCIEGSFSGQAASRALHLEYIGIEGTHVVGWDDFWMIRGVSPNEDSK